MFTAKTPKLGLESATERDAQPDPSRLARLGAADGRGPAAQVAAGRSAGPGAPVPHAIDRISVAHRLAAGRRPDYQPHTLAMARSASARA